MHQDILINPAEEPGDRDTLLTILAEIIVRVARTGQQAPDEPAADAPAPRERPAAA